MTAAAVQPGLVSSIAQMIVEKPMTEPTDKIDAAEQDDDRHAGGDQAGDRDLAQHVGQIAVGQEDVAAGRRVRRGEGADQADEQQAPNRAWCATRARSNAS